MGTMVSATAAARNRRPVLVTVGLLLAGCAQLSLAVAASAAGSWTDRTLPKLPPAHAAPPGVLTNVTKGLTARWVSTGDYVSSGWTISMIGSHPATTVKVTDVTATIPLTCLADEHFRVVSLVLRMPDAVESFSAGDTSWRPTASTADAAGYEASQRVGQLCHDGALLPHGNATYAAKLVSADTKNLFAMRFHSVDARTNQGAGHGNPVNPNTDCDSASQNHSGVAQCNAAWTVATTSAASVLVPPPGVGPGTPGIPSPPQPPNPGTVTGPVGSAVGSVGSLVARPPHALTAARRPAAPASRPAAATPPSTATGDIQPIPLLVLPAPSRSTVLGPVPLPIPVIDGVTAGVSGALPWKWFLLLAFVDLGLIAVVVARRRSAQRDRRSAG